MEWIGAVEIKLEEAVVAALAGRGLSFKIIGVGAEGSATASSRSETINNGGADPGPSFRQAQRKDLIPHDTYAQHGDMTRCQFSWPAPANGGGRNEWHDPMLSSTPEVHTHRQGVRPSAQRN